MKSRLCNIDAVEQKVAWPGCVVAMMSLLAWDPSIAIDAPRRTSVSAGTEIPLEKREFEQVGGTHEDDTPGVLKYGAYHSRGANVTRTNFRAVGRAKGGASVEIARHPDEYAYVIRDFFGTFRTTASGNWNSWQRDDVSVVDGKVKEGKWHWRFLNWSNRDNDATSTICITVIPKESGAYGGLVGWYSENQGEMETVMIRFDQLDGLPKSLIDSVLAEHPGFVRETDFRGESWLADDVRKWVRLVELYRSDQVLMQMALGRLAAYDHNMFGVEPKRLESGDEEVFEAEMHTLRDRAEKWIQEREAKGARPGDS